MYIRVISPMISNLQTHAAQSRARASLHDGCQCFYRVNSDTAFERPGSRIPVNDLNSVRAIKKHLIQFLGLTELTIKYGLGDFDMKLYRMAPKPRGKSDNFAITTDDQSWSFQLCWMTQEAKWTVCILGACVFVSCSGV